MIAFFFFSRIISVVRYSGCRVGVVRYLHDFLCWDGYYVGSEVICDLSVRFL